MCYTTVRPIITDQHYSRITLLAEDDQDARTTAYYWVHNRRGVEMVTRCEIEAVVL